MLLANEAVDGPTTAVGLPFAPASSMGPRYRPPAPRRPGSAREGFVRTAPSVGAAAPVTETGVRYVRRDADEANRGVLAPRGIGYVPPSAVPVTAAIYNAGPIARGLAGA